jgi:hypothetical protein|tara:strand:- start:1254 stop:1400 length:147 start_codon:yes stop_codon:yes gene_type:complete
MMILPAVCTFVIQMVTDTVDVNPMSQSLKVLSRRRVGNFGAVKPKQKD